MLSFSDAVNASSFDQTNVILQNAATSATASLRLAGGTAAQSGAGRIITISLTTSQQDVVKADTNLVTSYLTSYVQLEANTLADFAGNLLAALASQQVRTFTADTTAPVLSTFSLNMNSGRLGLTFSEAVQASTLDTTNLTLQHIANSVNAAQRYTMTSTGTVSTANSNIVTVDLSIGDLNGVKTIDVLAKSSVSTFLSLTAGFVSDMSGVAIAAIPTTTAQAVTTYTGDTVSPTLNSFTLNLDSNPALLALTFSEPIKASSLSPTQITLVGARSTTADSHKLTGGTTSTANGVTQTVSLTASDLFAIQALSSLATSNANTYLSVTSAAAQDMFGLSLVAITVPSAQQTANLTSDAAGPTLNSYTLDVDSGLLVLTFNEVIDVAAIQLPKFVIQSSSTAPASQFTLTSNSQVTTTANSQIITIDLKTDLDSIKLSTRLAVNISTSFLQLGASAVSDPLGNPSAALATGRAVASYTADTSPPTLQEFVYDSAIGMLVVTFSEPIDASTLSVGKFTLQHSKTANLPSTGQYALTTSSAGSLDGKVLNLTLSIVDFVQLQNRAELASSRSNTFLRVDADAIRDMSGLAIATLAATQAVQATNFVGDTSGPTITSYTLDVDTGKLTMTFSEAVNQTSFVATTISISNSSSATGEKVTLSTAGTVVKSSATVLELTLSETDLDALKIARTIGTSTANTFLSHTAGLVEDFVDNVATAREVGLASALITGDATSPTLTEFSLNMDSGVLGLTFDEAVNTLLLNIGQLTFQDGQTLSQVSYTPKASTTPTTLARIVTATLSATDLNEVKRLTLCTSRADCFLVFPNTTVTDIQGNSVNAIEDGSALQAMYTADTNKPSLVQFSLLDLNTGELELSFNETVKASTFSTTAVTLQNWAGGSSVTSLRQLTGGTVYRTDATKIRFTLVKADLDVLKADTTLCDRAVSCHVRFTSGLVDDMASNDVVAVVNKSTGVLTTEYPLTFTPDTTSPQLLSWGLDLDSGLVNLTFSEPVVAAQLQPNTLTLQNLAASPTAVFALTGHKGIATSGNVLEVQFTIRDIDLQRIKADTALCTSVSDCFASFTSGFASDTASNAVAPRLSSSELQLSSFSGDITRPSITQFSSLDMNVGRMILVFNEPIDRNSIVASRITLQAQGNVGTNYTLTGAENVTDASDKTTITFDLNDADVRGVKILSGLVTGRATSFVSIAAGAVKDTSGNEVNSLDSSSALQVRL